MLNVVEKFKRQAYDKCKKDGDTMTRKALRRSKPVFPIGTMMMLTDLTARQIRYYEEQGLIFPERSEKNRRLYSLNDVDTLLDIKDYLTDGLTITAIKNMRQKEQDNNDGTPRVLTDEDVRRILYNELLNQQEWRHHIK